jgi:trehalose synthase
VDRPTAGSRTAWRFLAPLLDGVARVAFSVAHPVPDELHGLPSTVITPIIWPFSAKNRDMTGGEVAGCLRRTGLTGSGWDPGEPLVVQVSRWDRLKDMHGVLSAFAEHVPTGRLALVGPDPAGIPDDVDQARWFAACVAAHQTLPARQRNRIRLVCLPMSDPHDNALLVNAVQRTARVVVQKSLAEGFGLTVTEAMWKGRPVIGSAVGGITTQIAHGRNGFLVRDPNDGAELGALVTAALRDGGGSAAMGARAHHDVHRAFLPDTDLAATRALLTTPS